MGAMNLFDAAPADVRPLLTDERVDLLSFLRALAPALTRDAA